MKALIQIRKETIESLLLLVGRQHPAIKSKTV